MTTDQFLQWLEQNYLMFEPSRYIAAIRLHDAEVVESHNEQLQPGCTGKWEVIETYNMNDLIGRFVPDTLESAQLSTAIIKLASGDARVFKMLKSNWLPKAPELIAKQMDHGVTDDDTFSDSDDRDLWLVIKQ